MEDDLIAARAAAAILDVSRQRVQQLATEGKLLPVGYVPTRDTRSHGRMILPHDSRTTLLAQ